MIGKRFNPLEMVNTHILACGMNVNENVRTRVGSRTDGR